MRPPWFSPSKACKCLLGHRFVHPAFTWLWKSTFQRKHKVFFGNQTRYVLEISEETLEHLFLDCPFAHLVVQPGDPFHTLASFRNQLAVSFSMNIIITMSWCIWMEQNDLIFKGIHPSLGNLCFKKEFALVILRAKTTCERLRCTVSI
jgi:hypothetical protein